MSDRRCIAVLVRQLPHHPERDGVGEHLAVRCAQETRGFCKQQEKSRSAAPTGAFQRFSSPSRALANGPHGPVGIFIVKNNAQATHHGRPHVQVGSSRRVRRVASLAKTQLGSFRQNAPCLLALVLRSIAARQECISFHCRTALRCARTFEFAERFSRARSSERVRL
jgi:hypothetical protein